MNVFLYIKLVYLRNLLLLLLLISFWLVFDSINTIIVDHVTQNTELDTYKCSLFHFECFNYCDIFHSHEIFCSSSFWIICYFLFRLKHVHILLDGNNARISFMMTACILLVIKPLLMDIFLENIFILLRNFVHIFCLCIFLSSLFKALLFVNFISQNHNIKFFFYSF